MSLFTNGTTSFGNSTSGSLSADCTLFNEAFPDFAQYDGFSDCSAFNFYQDDQGDITSFFLNDGSFDYPIQINGPIPDSFADLTYLTYLSLTNANITSVGTEICTFTALTALDLSGNSFPSLPDCISDLAQLQYLTLSFSGLTKLTTGVCEITPLSSM
ncbi:hypothetical protein BC830DRAFT_362021 [Chytriomyces sp. MP71]|nr:hypothetical protein BC830DRAFT_362021 [Chytriomyces sp. MP71]